MPDLPPSDCTMSAYPSHYCLVCEVIDDTKMTRVASPGRSYDKLSRVVSPGYDRCGITGRVVNPGSTQPPILVLL